MKKALACGMLLLSGCGRGSDGASKEEVDRALGQIGEQHAVWNLEEAVKNQHKLKEEADLLLKQALTAPGIRERSAALLASREGVLGDLSKSLDAVSTAVDVVASNLSNVNTTGFKCQRVKVLDGQARIVRDFSQGSQDATDRRLDLMIEGEGFFRVRIDASGVIGYTRAGCFMRSPDGVLQDPDGHPLEPRIQLDAQSSTDSLVIGEDGRLAVPFSGQVVLARFPNPEGLKLQGGLYVETEDSGKPIPDHPGRQGLGLIRQGRLEGSNVDLVREMTQMMILERWYEIICEMLRSLDPH